MERKIEKKNTGGLREITFYSGVQKNISERAILHGH
jgi:hypothetical protein